MYDLQSSVTDKGTGDIFLLEHRCGNPICSKGRQTILHESVIYGPV